MGRRFEGREGRFGALVLRRIEVVKNPKKKPNEQYLLMRIEFFLTRAQPGHGYRRSPRTTATQHLRFL